MRILIERYLYHYWWGHFVDNDKSNAGRKSFNRLNDGKLAKAMNKLLIRAILAVSCMHVVNGVVGCFDTSFSKLGNEAAHAGIVANITVINKSGNSFS